MSNRNTLIFVVVIISVVAVYAVAVHFPQSRRLIEVRDQIGRVSQRCEEDETKSATIPQLRADVTRLKGQFQDFDRRLPRQQELGEFLREISSTSVAGQLDDQSIQPGNPSTGELYNRLPILMDFTCSFAELVGFLDRLNGMPRLTRVERIRMEPADEQRLKVHMQVNIYFTKT